MTTKININTATGMSGWHMAASILVGLQKAQAQARDEFEAIRTANPGKPFTPGLGLANDLLNSISKAKQDFEYDMRRMARSSGLEMPAKHPHK